MHVSSRKLTQGYASSGIAICPEKINMRIGKRDRLSAFICMYYFIILVYSELSLKRCLSRVQIEL